MEASNEQLIVRYLLGDLPEADQVRIEDRAFSDRAYRRNIEDAENDLIDDYVRGTLSETERRQFEHRFFASAERRRKVEFARALAQVVSANATEDTAEPARSRWRDVVTAFLRGLNPALQFSLAAATLILLAGLSWLVIETRNLRSQVARLQAAEQTRQRQEEILREQARQESTRSAELTAQLEREREQRGRSEEPARRPERQQRERPAGASFITSLFLLPGTARGGAERPKLIVPHTSRTVRLRIGLEREDEYRSFSVEIRTAQGREVWSQDHLRPRESRAGRVINVLIPGTAFSAGEYELTLRGMTDTQTEDVRFYYFSVLRQ
ncbi:MAG: hypothetical protein U0Z53_22900 [Blastocatellia bacterium]